MSRAQRPSQAEINERVLSSDRPSDQLGARTIRGGAIAVSAQILRVLLQIVGIAVLARLLLPEHFGLVAMGGTVTALVTVLTELNLSSAAVQRDTLDQDTASGMLAISIGMGVASFGLAAVLMPAALSVFEDDRVGLIVLWLAAAAPVQATGSLHYALMTRNMRWLDLHFATLASFVIGTAAAIIGAWAFDIGYWALVVQVWAMSIASSVLGWLCCPWRPSWVRDWSGALSSLRFGLNMSGAMILHYANRQVDNILIGSRWGSAELGFYARAQTLLQTPLNFITGPLSSAMVPALSQMQNDPEKWRKAYLDALSAITFIGGAMACLLYGGAGAIISIVMGPGWERTELIFSYLAIALLAATPMRTTGWIYLSLGRTDRMLQWALIATPVYIGAFFLGLPHGAPGLALAFSIAQLAAFLPCMWMAVRDTSVSMTDVLAAIAFPTAATVAVGLGLAGVSASLSPWEGVLAIAAAGLAYAGLIVAAVLHLPVYQRLRQRGLDMVGMVLARLPLRTGKR